MITLARITDFFFSARDQGACTYCECAVPWSSVFNAQLGFLKVASMKELYIEVQTTQRMQEGFRSSAGKLLSACDTKWIPNSKLGLRGGADGSNFA